MKDFLEQIHLEWLKKPDLRFGQMMSNFFAEAGDPFSWEEDVFICKFNEYMTSSEHYSGEVEGE